MPFRYSWATPRVSSTPSGGSVVAVAPTHTSATIPNGGDSISLVYSESVTVGAGGNGGHALSMSGGAVTMTYASGSGSTTFIYSLSRTVQSGETGTLNYTQPGNGIEATTGGLDVANYTNHSVTNNSTDSSSDLDWIARSTAPGVEVANRLQTPGDLADWVVMDGSQSHLSVDSSVKVSGASASFKFDILNSDTTSSGAVSVPFPTKGVGDTFWLSFRVRADDIGAYQQWVFNSQTGNKLCIISRDQNGAAPIGSNQVNEIVPSINYSNNTWGIYHQDGISTAVQPAIGAVTPCSPTDFKLLPAIDNGANPLTGNDPATGSAWSACQQARAQFGGLYSAWSLAEYQEGIGDPLSGGPRQISDEWHTITVRIEVNALDGTSATNRISMWSARDGEPYVMVLDMQNAVLGAGPDFNGCSLLPYVTNRSAGGRQASLSGISGASIIGVGGGTALGAGVLEYTASTGAFRFRAQNDSFGTARYISAANNVFLMNLKSSSHGAATTTTGSVTLPQSSIAVADASAFPVGGGSVVLGAPDTSNPNASNGNGEQYLTYTGKSGNTLTGCSGGSGTHNSGVPVRIHSYIGVRIDNPALLPGSGVTTATVTVSDGRKNGAIHYNDFICSTQPINAPGGYAPAGVNPLADLAASMSPNTWAPLTVTGQNAALGAGDNDGSMLPWANTMPFNPVNQSIEVIGRDHHYTSAQYGQDGANRYARFSLATNSWAFIADLPEVKDGHGGDTLTINPTNGDLYWRMYTAFTGLIRAKKKPMTDSNFSDIPSVSGVEQVAIGTTWWSGSFTGGGAQGLYMIFNSGNSVGNANDGQIVAYNPITNTWVFNQVAMAPFYGSGSTYSSVMEYDSIKNVAVYGGGGAAPQKLWRLNSSGVAAAMPDTPGTTRVGLQEGILVNAPNLGGFLLLSQGQLWALNPDGAGTWTQKATPPVAVGDPDAPHNMIAVAIPEYGVVAVITQHNQGSGNFYLYKPG